ncbi:MAG: tetratricopeptide repeat protein [Desulfarculus sp.]|nr:tetratricopeptide repeat protein [Desulfarculus sp.]
MRLLWDQGGLWSLMALEACRGLGLAVAPISAAQVAAGELAGARLLLVPGGWPSRKLQALGQAGGRAIREFVRGGGTYLGFCGGAGLALRVEDGLGLIDLGRAQGDQRLPGLSGPLWVEAGPQGHGHPLWQGLARPVSLPVWWPAQFATPSAPGLEVIATYGPPAPGLCTADLRVDQVDPADWPAHEAAYGQRLDPACLAGRPAMLKARLGRGLVFLSYLHLDTPGEAAAGQALGNLWRAWLGPGACAPPAGPEPEPRRNPQAQALADQARALWHLGLDLGLWRPRHPQMPLWRRGARGLEFWGLLRLCQAVARAASPGAEHGAILAELATALEPVWQEGPWVLQAQAARLAGGQPDPAAAALERAWFPAPRRLAGPLARGSKIAPLGRGLKRQEKDMTLSMRIPGLVLAMACWLATTVPAWADNVDLGVITVKDKALAESIRQRLTKGEGFEGLAKAHSVGATAQRGGRLGMVPEERLRSEYRQALKGLKPGQPSAVVATEEGYNVLVRFDQAPPAAPATAKAPATAPPATGATARPSAPVPAAPAPASARGGQALDSPQLAARLEVMAGLEQMTAGRIKVAEGHLSKALGLNPREDSAAFLLEVARAALAGKIKPEAASAFAEGFVRMFNNQGSEALALFGQAKKLDPRLWQAALFEANLLAGSGRAAEATALLQQMLKENPGLARPHLTLGLIYQDQRQLDQAADQYKKALAVDPELAEAHYRLGNLALGLGRWEEAEAALKSTLAADPFKEEAYNDLGLVFAASGRPQEAEKAYKKALELNPEFPTAHINLGILYASGGRVNQGIDEFNKALALDPNLGFAHNNLATAYAMKEEWGKAIQHADLAVKLGVPVADVLIQKLAPHRK